ncbi:MAG: hypothetical protein AB7I27_10440 [Bacteriovoracaceae bacterium]
MKMIFSLIALALTLTAFAGENGGGTLDCQSSSGRTTLSGMAGVDELDFNQADVKLTVDKKVLSFNTESLISRNGVSAVGVVTYNKKAKVYNLVFVEKFTLDRGYDLTKKTLSLMAIPASFKEVSQDVYKFVALLSGADPRKNQKETLDGSIQMLENTITLNCTLDLSI